MKKYTWFLFLFLISCSGKSPKSVAENYLTAFHKRDYESAKKYCTEESKKLMDMFLSFEKLIPDSSKKELSFNVLRDSIHGDTAFVKYLPEGESIEQTLTLIKVDEEWKVIATKDNLNEMEGGEPMDSGATNTDTIQAEDTTAGAG